MIAIGSANKPREGVLYNQNNNMNAPTNIIANAVVNSNILLNGACPEAPQRVKKYPRCVRKPIIVIVIPIFPHLLLLYDSLELAPFTAPPKKSVATKYATNEMSSKLELHDAKSII